MNKFIIITNNNGQFSSRYFDDHIPLEFDLIYVLGDFLNIRNLEKNSYDYEKHIFTVVDGRDKIKPRGFEKQVSEASYHLDKFIEMVQQNEMGTLKNFDDIKKSFGIKFDYTIRPLNEDIDIYNAFTNPPLRFIKEYLNKDYEFSYSCDSISALVASIIHFYLINQYHLVQCLHCGNFYATKTLKQNYCRRLSPYVDPYTQKNYEPKTCKETVKAARKQLNRRMLRIYKKIEDKAEHQLGNHEFYNGFTKECEKYLNLIYKESSVKNLTSFNDYLEKIETSEELKK